MIRVIRTGNFEANVKLYQENEELFEEIRRRIKWFRKNPEDTRLENHPLNQRLEGKWSFNITGDVRILYEWLGKTTARFLAIGLHSRVYRKN